MIRGLALLALAGCAPEVVSSITTPERRCDEAKAIYRDLEPTARNAALVYAACAQVLVP